MAGNNDHVYQLLTDDVMELVLVQTDTLPEMEAETGISLTTLACALSRKRRVKYKGTKVRIIRVDLDDDEEELEDGK